MTTAALEVVTPATTYPITVSDAKSQLRITHGEEDQHIQNLIAAATRWAEVETRRVFMTTEVRLRMDRFPYRREHCYFEFDDFRNVSPNYKYSRQEEKHARDRQIFLPGGKVTAIEDIVYTDADSAPQTLTGPTSGTPGTDYQEDLTDSDEAWVMPAAQGDWPAVADAVVNAVVVRYQVGYGAAEDDVPHDIRMAIRFRVADLFTYRDSADAGNKSDFFKAAENLLFPHRIQVF